MSRFHLTTVSILLALAAVLGAVAVARTTGLGAASHTAGGAAIAAKTRQLNAFEAKLRAELARATAVTPATASAAQPRIVYQRPPPVVVVRHLHHGEGGYEAEGGGGNDD